MDITSLPEDTQPASDSYLLLDACPGYIWLLDGIHCWSYINLAARNFVGSAKASSWTSAVHPEDLGNLITTLEKAWNQLAPAGCLLRVRSSHGVWRDIHHQFQTDRSRGIIVGNGHDVTSYRNSGRQLMLRQRFLSALAMAQRIMRQPLDAAAKISQLEEIAAQAVDNEKVEFWVLSTPGDFNCLLRHRDFHDNETREALRQMLLSPGVMETLRTGAHAEDGDDKGITVLVPVMEKSQCFALAAAHLPRNQAITRSELDFLQNIGGLLSFL